MSESNFMTNNNITLRDIDHDMSSDTFIVRYNAPQCSFALVIKYDSNHDVTVSLRDAESAVNMLPVLNAADLIAQVLPHANAQIDVLLNGDDSDAGEL